MDTGINIYWTSLYILCENQPRRDIAFYPALGNNHGVDISATRAGGHSRNKWDFEPTNAISFAPMFRQWGVGNGVSVSHSGLLSSNGSERGSSDGIEHFFEHSASTRRQRGPTQLWFVISEACNCEIVSRCYWPDGDADELTPRCTSKINSSPAELVSLPVAGFYLNSSARGTDNLGLPIWMALRSWNSSFKRSANILYW